MKNRKYEDLEKWEQAFFDLNKKIGNDAWGARLEGSGTSESYRLRIFMNNASVEEKILKETNGFLEGHPLVFTVYTQEAYSLREHRQTFHEALAHLQDLVKDPIEVEINVEEHAE